MSLFCDVVAPRSLNSIALHCVEWVWTHPKFCHGSDDLPIVKPGNESLIAAGTWCPGKNELGTIRFVKSPCWLMLSDHPCFVPVLIRFLALSWIIIDRSNIKHNSRHLRDIISSTEFELFFGEAKPHPKGERQNIFGREDELKTAPKGVAKDHQWVAFILKLVSYCDFLFRDIDLLKCRSFAVAHWYVVYDRPVFFDKRRWGGRLGKIYHGIRDAPILRVCLWDIPLHLLHLSCLPIPRSLTL